MGGIVLALVVGWAFERVHMIVTAPNYGSTFNGYGAIELTAKREIKAPMAYRLLIPLLVIGIERLFRIPLTRRIDVYQTLKVALNGLAFWAVWMAWGAPVALLTFIVLLVTIKYDYWDWAVELAALALAMTGNLALALPIAILYAASRETAPLAVVAYWCASGDVGGSVALAGAIVLTMALVRLWVGKKPLYCERWQWRYNLGLFRDFWKWQPFYHSDIFIACTLTLLGIAAAFFLPVGWPVPLALLGAGWTLAKADETRVFTGALPWIAALLVGGL